MAKHISILEFNVLIFNVKSDQNVQFLMTFFSFSVERIKKPKAKFRLIYLILLKQSSI